MSISSIFVFPNGHKQFNLIIPLIRTPSNSHIFISSLGYQIRGVLLCTLNVLGCGRSKSKTKQIQQHNWQALQVVIHKTFTTLCLLECKAQVSCQSLGPRSVQIPLYTSSTGYLCLSHTCTKPIRNVCFACLSVLYRNTEAICQLLFV